MRVIAAPALFSPFGEHQEELVDQRGRHSVRVELASPGHQHGPWHSTQKPQHVGVDPATCRQRTHEKMSRLGAVLRATRYFRVLRLLFGCNESSCIFLFLLSSLSPKSQKDFNFFILCDAKVLQGFTSISRWCCNVTSTVCLSLFLG